MWTEILGSVATVVAVGGVLLSNRKNRACYLLWLFSNSATLLIHAYAGIWSLAARDLIFLALAVEGWILWRPK
jgi:nicotinamide riboside transporter PnuC